MKLNKILKAIKYKSIKGSLDVEITSLSQKVEDIKEGAIFFCIKGQNVDGHDLYNIAKEKGAVCLIVERFVDCDITQVLVSNTRKVIGKVCNKFFNNIAGKIKFIGVTGTNGKTTTSNIIYQILNCAGKKAGLIGTNGIEFNGQKLKSSLTTPDTVDLFYIINEMNSYGIEYVVMEVSAHAIHFNKITGIKYEVGIFSNLTQDHLDFFKNMHTYALTKLKFLNKKYCKNILINIDDEYGKLFVKLSNSKVYTYGLNNPSDCFGMDIKLNINKTKFLANIFDNVFEFESNLTCLFNVYNILAAASCCKILQIENEHIFNGIKNLQCVDGRMNFFKLKNGAYAVIDYAHTPDGLQKVLEYLRQLKLDKKLFCVFGCGGNRDKSKRHIMGEVAFALSDKIFVTSDNPRDENPNKIIDDICINIKGEYFRNDDRSIAIKTAYNESKSGDLILVAGKGCELVQEIRGQKKPYSDLEEIKKYI